ncbi:raffinose/stachyose/melibiose transport system permease protein [Caldalkalibacillus uzonensis]|uniref:Raffinose/stachyose/melibiose transport system permease protein n=1 Tax=Caldalkalibacillus uzonensis TaxID=353224 RepID=A0ABU0CQX2_9BACI|nr:sugar ABC transporter permease [Caldalkalibacillus uzonensis]MDQ0338815.1 raffinose/stachyose/melibiose transport system permease protein [Caldalkalibacillus uzonensis]
MNIDQIVSKKEQTKVISSAPKRNSQFKKRLTILLFILPALIVYMIYVVYPIITTFNYSLFSWSGTQREKIFVGLTNYIQLFADSTFWMALKNNIKIVLVSVFVQIPLGLVMALILFSSIKGRKVFNVLYFLPYLMSTVAIGLLWIYMYDPVNGPVNRVLDIFGFSPVAWLADPILAMTSVLIVIVWQFAPFYMILFKAAMVGIPDELYEAADMDGANSFHKFVYITLPSLMPTIVTSSVLAVVGSLKAFDIFYIMTRGGPGHATEILGTYMYKQGFVNLNMGYASAIAFMMFLIAFVIVVLIQVIEYQRRKRGLLTP